MSSRPGRARARTILITMAAVGMALAAPATLVAAPDMNMYEGPDGSRWLWGCVNDKTAAHLLAHEAFQGSGPVVVLCLEGYTLVHKHLK